MRLRSIYVNCERHEYFHFFAAAADTFVSFTAGSVNLRDRTAYAIDFGLTSDGCQFASLPEPQLLSFIVRLIERKSGFYFYFNNFQLCCWLIGRCGDGCFGYFALAQHNITKYDRIRQNETRKAISRVSALLATGKSPLLFSGDVLKRAQHTHTRAQRLYEQSINDGLSTIEHPIIIAYVLCTCETRLRCKRDKKKE